MISALRAVGYDGVVSIEHEDALMSIDEGLSKAVNLIKRSAQFMKHNRHVVGIVIEQEIRSCINLE